MGLRSRWSFSRIPMICPLGFLLRRQRFWETEPFSIRSLVLSRDVACGLRSRVESSSQRVMMRTACCLVSARGSFEVKIWAT